MVSVRFLFLILALWCLLFTVSEAREILVGGKENSWTIPPSANFFNMWAEKIRFRKGDFLRKLSSNSFNFIDWIISFSFPTFSLIFLFLTQSGNTTARQILFSKWRRKTTTTAKRQNLSKNTKTMTRRSSWVVRGRTTSSVEPKNTVRKDKKS